MTETTPEVSQSELSAEFEDDAALVYAVDSQFRIFYANASWDRSAAENGGGGLRRERHIGLSVMAVTPLVLRPFYALLYDRVLRGGEQVDREYDCSSDTAYRRYHMFMARRDVPGQGPGLIVVNSLVFEDEHPYQAFPFDAKVLREENGYFRMCCHCRRTRMPGTVNHWVWVPDLVRDPPSTVSHGICQVCFGLHFGRRAP